MKKHLWWITCSVFPLVSNANQLTIDTKTVYVRDGDGARCVLEANGAPNKKLISFTITQLDDDSVATKTETFNDIIDGRKIFNSSVFIPTTENKGNADKNNKSCVLTDARIEGLGRSQINYTVRSSDGAFGLESKLTWKTLKKNQGPLTEVFIAGQILALPIASKIANNNAFLDDLNIVIDNANLSSKYRQYKEAVISGSTGFNGGVLGFSIDFLDLKTKGEINDFLARRSVELAIKLGLVASSVNVDELADFIRTEVLYLLNQDSQMEYGSTSQVKSSLTMMYGDMIKSGWQVNINANRNINSNEINKIPTWFYFSEENKKRTKDNYGYDNVQQIADYFILRNHTDKYDIAFAKRVLKEVNGIEIDYSGGVITNNNRHGGYLGKTYITITEDLYGKKAGELSYQDFLLVKTALNVIGIDTNYPYGSLRNIQASVLMRIDAYLKESIFHQDIYGGASTEVIDALNYTRGVNLEKPIKELMMKAYVSSGIATFDEKSNNPVGDGVTIYSGYDQKGSDVVIYNDTPSLDSFNDKLSSWNIPKGWEVRFYEHGNFKGAFWTRGPGKGDATAFNDKVSSIKIIKKPMENNELIEPHVYENYGQAGQAIKISNDIPYLDSFNDRLSSWNIPKGWEVRFYEHGNFKGTFWTRGPGKGDATAFNDKVSSIKIIKKPLENNELIEPHVYENYGQAGQAIKISNDMPYLDSFNDRLSSWNIPKGWEVRFYEHGNFKGAFWTRGPGKGDATAFNDKVSSIKVLKSPNTASGDQSNQIKSKSKMLFIIYIAI
ncbi:hypothetical protein ACET9P_22105 [Aeromonas veronii]